MIGANRTTRGLLGGYFFILLVFLYAPLVVLVVFAFNDSTVPSLPLSGFTTQWFHAAFSNTDLTGSVRRSLALATLDGILATVLGILAAAGLASKRVFLRPVITTSCSCRWWCPTSCSRWAS